MIDTGFEPVALLPVVALALVAEDRRVLLARRPVGDPLAGLWEFPGGKIAAGERPEAALVREAREELGIEIDAATLTPVGFASAALGTRHLLLLLFRADRWSGTPRPLAASELCWASCADMAALAMPPADRPLVAMLARVLAGQEPEAGDGIAPTACLRRANGSAT